MPTAKKTPSKAKKETTTKKTPSKRGPLSKKTETPVATKSTPAKRTSKRKLSTKEEDAADPITSNSDTVALSTTKAKKTTKKLKSEPKKKTVTSTTTPTPTATKKVEKKVKRKQPEAMQMNDSDDESDSDFSGLEDDLEVPLTESELAELESIGKTKGKEAKKVLAKNNNKKKGSASKTQTNEDGSDVVKNAVMYVGHIPYGFFEKQLRKFFSQFGDVMHVRVARSKRTGNSKGYAFVGFNDKDVAEIAANSMNNYMMFGRTLKCQVMPEDKVHPTIFKGADRPFRKVPWARIERERHNQVRDAAQKKKRKAGILKRQAKLKNTLKEMGIKYIFPGHTN